MSTLEEAAAHQELQAWSLARGDPAFIHQHVVDAWAAQHAEPGDPAIGLAFALVGLCLHLEYGFTGRQVQLAHMALARRGGKRWPRFPMPDDRGEIRATDVMAAAPGPDRDQALSRWCASVWDAHLENHGAVRALLVHYGYQPGADRTG